MVSLNFLAVVKIKIIEKYKKCGYQANQDVPGNFYWKDLYDASPDAKVILTVRDDVETWRNSWRTFMKQV